MADVGCCTWIPAWILLGGTGGVFLFVVSSVPSLLGGGNEHMPWGIDDMEWVLDDGWLAT